MVSSGRPDNDDDDEQDILWSASVYAITSAVFT